MERTVEVIPDDTANEIEEMTPLPEEVNQETETINAEVKVESSTESASVTTQDPSSIPWLKLRRKRRPLKLQMSL